MYIIYAFKCVLLKGVNKIAGNCSSYIYTYIDDQLPDFFFDLYV